MNRGRLIIGVMTLVIFIAPLVAQAVETKSLPRAGSFKIPTDNDTINLFVEVADENDNGFITFCLSSSQKVKWWKGLKVFGNSTSSAKALLVTQDDDHGPSCRRISTSALDENNSRLEFWKAKAFGVHTDMVHYTFYPSDYNGQTLRFTWMND